VGIQWIYGALLTAPTVTNSIGASNITSNSARLNGEVTSIGSGNPTVHIYWGSSDGGTTPGSWAHDVDLGVKAAGVFYTDISSLTSGTPYYYRCYAVNSAGSDWADATASFTTTGPAPQKLIGVDAGTSSTGAYPLNYFFLYRFQAVGTGNVVIFKIKTSASGNVKAAIYADNSGEPGALLSAVNTSTPVTAGWNNITITSTPVVTGNYYWLAYNSDSAIGYYQSAAGTLRYKTTTYSTFSFPNPAGTGFTSLTTSVGLLAGWGFSVPPTAPTVTNATGASSITSNSARLNGEVTSTGNENPTVHIYWGTTDGGTITGNWTHDENLGTKGAETFYKNITGLAASTTYYYRCYATNSAGSDWADATASFPTSAPPSLPTVSTTAASDITSNSARLTGEVTSTGGEDPTVRIYWGTSVGITSYLEGVWGSSATDVFAVGGAGTILHYNGSAWSEMASGTTNYLVGVWGSSATDVFAVGYLGTIVHYNGSAWSEMTSGTTNYLVGVWGSSATDVFAVGEGGTIRRYNGSAWSAMTSGTTNYLFGVWGSSATDVFAVGELGTIRHYNGSAWSEMTSGTTNILYGVWGTSATNVFAVGQDGTIRHYNGSAWSAMTSGTTAWLDGVWGSSATDVFAVGAGDTILHYNGSAWSAMTSGITYGLYDVWGSSATDVFAVGWTGTILHYNGSAWAWSLFLGWSHGENLGTKGVGTFYADISSLTPSTTYYYRCYAQNSGGCDWADATASFTTAAAPQKLIGVDAGAPSTGAYPQNYFFLYRFQAVGTGDVVTFKIKTSASGNVKVAIYADNSGEPGALLSAVNTSTLVVAGWNSITITSTPVVTGIYYWLAYNSDSAIGYYYSTGGTLRYKTTTYSSFTFPNPAGTGFSSLSSNGLLAGWGSVAPPTPPTVTNASGASNIMPTSATLNGVVTDTGHQDPTVHIYWGPTDGGTIAGNWTHDENLGTKGAETFYKNITGLSASTTYYYRCYAVNSAGGSWAASTLDFATLPPPSLPAVNNSTGASNIMPTSATLNGEVTSTGGENPTVFIYWGPTDGGTDSGNWANSVKLGVKAAGVFNTDISSLTPSTLYYYRCYAVNSAGPDWADATAYFTTIAAPQKLIGVDAGAPSTGAYPGNYFFLYRFQAVDTGNVVIFRIKTSGSGNVKVAIYADSAGAPGARLSAVNTSTPVTAGWNNIIITSTHVVTGNYYWLAYNSDAAIGYYQSTGGTLRYKTATYSTFSFPDPAGTGFSSLSSNGLLAGWGFFVPPPLPSAPTLVSPGAAITFKWNASTGATKYHLQVNTNSSFTGASVFNDEVGDVTSKEVTGLTLGTTYYWRVKAGNAGGWSDWSSVRSVIASEVP
jgi:hypothetical protein